MNKAQLRRSRFGARIGCVVSDLPADKSVSMMSWRRCRRRGVGALQMAASGQGFLATRFGRTLECADIIFIPPHNGAIRIFLTIGSVGLLQVVSVAFEDYASLFCM
jgi:hypothetical protein